MEEFFSWAETFFVLPNSKLGKVIEYALNYKEGFCFFGGRSYRELSNNRAERAIKELVIGRKNWLFSKSEQGAKSSGIILSIFRTAIENGLEPRRYLIHLFEKIPKQSSQTPAALAAYLPWNETVQQIAAQTINKSRGLLYYTIQVDRGIFKYA